MLEHQFCLVHRGHYFPRSIQALAGGSVADDHSRLVGMITYTDLLREFVGCEGQQWRQIVIGTRRIFLIMRMDTGKSPKNEKTIEGFDCISSDNGLGRWHFSCCL